MLWPKLIKVVPTRGKTLVAAAPMMIRICLLDSPCWPIFNIRVWP